MSEQMGSILVIQAPDETKVNSPGDPQFLSRTNPVDCTIVLSFSTGEEQGTLGVESYNDQLTPEQLSSIKVVINLDMLGYDANQDWAMELWHGGHAGSLALAELIGDTIAAHQFRLVPEFAVRCG
jgi:hypothetical protein